MTVDRISTSPADALDLERFVKTDLGRKMLDLAREMRAGAAENKRRQSERDAQAAADLAIEATLEAELAAFAAADLAPFIMLDESGCSAVRYSTQPALLVNRNAHPSVLVSSALARAERAREFANLLENADDGPSHIDLARTGGALARMIEEVVELLRVVSEHSGIMNAPVSTMNTA